VQCRKDRERLAAGRRRIDSPARRWSWLPPQSNETAESLVAYMVPLRHALIDDNKGHVNLVVCESDYKALKLGIEHLPPMPH
jgi:hypothetical protein